MDPAQEPLSKVESKLILIVDDEEDMVKVLELLVKREGFQVDTAMDGQEALQKIEQRLPDLILLDLKMPRVSGLEIIRQLQVGDAAKVPVIVITGVRSDRQTEHLLKQEPNVKAYYSKPANSAILTMNIHTLLKTKPLLSRKPLEW